MNVGDYSQNGQAYFSELSGINELMAYILSSKCFSNLTLGKV